MTDLFRPSHMEKYLLCPGSYTAQQGLPESPINQLAESGIKIHKALKLALDIDDIKPLSVPDGAFDWLTDDRERKIAQDFANKVIEIVKEGDYSKWWIYPEYELNSADCSTGFGLPIRGTADLIVLGWRINDPKPDIIVFDYKTGYASQIDATRNLQLRAYCTLAAWQFADEKPQNVYGWIFSAGDTGNAQFTKVEFSDKDLAEAKDELGEIIVNCQDNPDKRIPGELQCKYCRACGNLSACSESVGNLSVTVSTSEALTVAVKPLPPAMATVAKNIFLQLRQLDAAKDKFNSWLKEVIKAYPDSVPWAELKPGKTKRTVVAPETVFQKGIEGRWFDQKQFMDCIKVSVPAVEKLTKTNLDLTAKQTSELVNSVLTEANAIEVSTDEPSIVVKKE